MSQEQEPAAGDDLFQFDERAPQGADSGPHAAPAEGTDEPAPDDASALQPMGLVDDTLGDSPAVREPAPLPSLPRGSLPPVVVPLLLVMAVANLALVGLTWKSLSRPEPASASAEHAAEGPAHAHPGEAGPHASPADSHGDAVRRELPHLTESRDEAWATLDDAERALEAGEFVAARRAFYALLTVLDRVDLAERPGIEARAGYLIAETYRLEAQAMDPEGAAEEAH